MNFLPASLFHSDPKAHGEVAVAPARDCHGARATPPARIASLPRSWLWASGLGLALLVSACSPTTEAPAPDKSVTAESQFPKTFASTAAAESWARDWYTGGRVDEVPTGEQRHLVVFMHGSGVPIIRLALYEWSQSRWTLVTITHPPSGTDEFLRATENDGKIILVGEKTGRTWPLDRK